VNRTKSLAAAVALTFAALLAGPNASPANAIGFLVSASPGLGQQLSTPPHSISLVFSVNTIPASLSGDVIRVTNSSGTAVEVGSAKVVGTTMSVDLNPNLAPDKYQVAYRYVCDDGHVLVSAYFFTLSSNTPAAEANGGSTAVGAKPTAEATAKPSSKPPSKPAQPSAIPSAAATASSTATASSSAAPTASGEATSSAMSSVTTQSPRGRQAQGDGFSAVFPALGGIFLVLAGLLWFWRKRRNAN
jgi:LPXTG-motif cell wall-anchored protein